MTALSKQTRRPSVRPHEASVSEEPTRWLVIRGARHNNLKNIDACIPLGRFVCVTGVSGSGKSSLVNDILHQQLARDLNGAENATPGRHSGIDGKQHLDKVIDIDQTPIGRTPRSNPVTYIKVFDLIRDWYAKLPDSRVRGYKPGRFSFNVATGDKGGGRCEACEGNGANRVEMDFLADVWVQCPVCAGRRFSHETLQIHYKGKSIADVLDMDVQDALQHFGDIPAIRSMLATLHDVGLDYVKLGQSSTTLSGGEAQRIKLARELVKKSTGRTLYLLDEPTTGLHFDDIRRLLAVLHGFVDAGNTVVVIEHNLDVIKTADWVIDLGPEGGGEGGYIVAAGTPEEIAACARSYTGQALRLVLGANAETPKRRNAETRGTLRRSPDVRRESAPGEHHEILVVGAREHNLKNITIGVPRGRMTVCSGVSGSGKSSFAIDTVYTEGQRRYVESLSAYARQFLGQLQKPKVDHIYGLSPAVAIEQQAASKSPRSTVGTVTEIYDYMRVLWARVGQPFCPRCQVPVGTQTADEIVERLMKMGDGVRVLLCAPIARGAGETWATLLERCRAQGYARVRVDGCVEEISSELSIDPRRHHTVELVVDRIVARSSSRSRIADSVEHCLALGQGVMIAVETPREENENTPSARWRTTPARDPDKRRESPSGAKQGVERAWRFSQHRACEQCGTSFEELTPHHFSFNSRLGWCPRCEGLGIQRGTTADAVFVRPERSVLSGAIVGWQHLDQRPLLRTMVTALAEAIGFDPDAPCTALTEDQRRALLFGLGEQWITVRPPKSTGLRQGDDLLEQNPKTDASDQSPNAPDQNRDRLPFTSCDGVKGEGAVSLKRGSRAPDQSPDASDQIPDRKEGVGTRTKQTRSLAVAALIPNKQWSKGPVLRFQWKGFFPAIDEATRVSWEYRYRLQDLATEVDCQVCGGARVRPEPAAARLGGRTIVDLCRMSLTAAAAFFDLLKLDRRQARIGGELLHEIKSRLRFLLDVGLGYLSLGRSAPTLSGGESQRIRLASQIGSGLTGVLYVLDEPTVGLHPRDNARLIAALHKLRDLGNTLLMVEHDREVIQSADHLIDFGPGAGANGGQVVAADAPHEVQRREGETPKRRNAETPKEETSRSQKVETANPGAPGQNVEESDRHSAKSLTGRYLAGVDAIAVPTNRRSVPEAPGLSRARPIRPGALGPGQARPSRIGAPGLGQGVVTCLSDASTAEDTADRWLIVRGARQNNLQRIDAAFPLGRFVCVTGVSGSGKSSLVTEILHPALALRLHRARVTPGAHERIDGLEHVDKVINVDQQPIGNSPWSNAATYTAVFDLIREVFARVPESRVRGYTANRFSFNRPGGRCDDCDGYGQVCYEMHFLPDVWVPCETCGGKRYQHETLEVRYKGQSIADVLDMPVSEARAHFENVPKVRRMLQTLEDVGLGYLPLGQSAPTLSGGEAQRVKLAAELGRPSTGKTVYILDEPTTGLHLDDLRKLLDVLHRLVDLGNTVICIEHHLDVIKTADWLIDLGPEAGDEGGRIVAAGTPEEVAAVAASHTGRLLREVLAAGPHRERPTYDPKTAAARATRTAEASLGESTDSGVKMPWERDGRRWHTRDRQSRDGQPIRWEGRALAFVVDEIERLGGDKLWPTNWSDRSRVEIKARAPTGVAQTAVPWLLHALTGGRWLIDLLFRVPRGTFSQRVLSAQLALKTLDEREDIEAYGQGSRVLLRPAGGPMDQVRVMVHDRAEIDTRGFREFLAKAWRAYLRHVESLASEAGGAEPWKQDGKAWHLSQRSIEPRDPKLWKPMTLLAFLGMAGKYVPDLKPLWDRKVFVELVTAGDCRIGRVITNKGAALRVDLFLPPGSVTPTQVEHLGPRQEFARPGSSGAGLTFWFQTIDEIHSEELKLALAATLPAAPADAAELIEEVGI